MAEEKKNPYVILGLDKKGIDENAAAEVIETEGKRRFIALSMKYHPDTGTDPDEKKFAEINKAWNILNSADNRRRYKMGLMDFDGEATLKGGGAVKANVVRDLGAFFGARVAARRNAGKTAAAPSAARPAAAREDGTSGGPLDLRATIALDFTAAAAGTIKKLRIGEAIVELPVPEGTEDGQVLRVRGQGKSAGGKTGDLLVKVNVASHDYFVREGNDILLELPVAFSEAVLGGTVTVPTVRGKAEVDVPPAAADGQELILPGEGIRGGNQVVTVKIVMPEAVDEEFADALRKWAERNPVDPRRHFRPD